jgi:hypothetical protein
MGADDFALLALWPAKGPMVDPNAYDSTHYDHYSLLRTIESNWELGNLGRNDTKGNTFDNALTHPTPF